MQEKRSDVTHMFAPVRAPPRLPGMTVVGIALLVLAGCAVRPVTPELTHFVPGGGYRWDPATVLPDNDPATLLALTFSGGGTRAAAFSFGVLEELQRTVVAGPSGTHRRVE